jgi:16S rRNA (cytosine1402-N4)-methyltransferase
MVEETLAALAPQPGERGVDATLGWGGHAERLLAALRPGGALLALDADPLELPKTVARLSALGFGEQELRARRTNFAQLRGALDAEGWTVGADFVLADLGVSSMQLDDPARGFGLKADGPLDMRLNPRRGPSAAEWLARASVAELDVALRRNADEPDAAAIAAALTGPRVRPATAAELAAAVRAAVMPRRKPEEAERAVRRVFQALRIEVNDEFGTLELLLRELPRCLRSGGRVAILTFHSGEDRRVKKAFQAGLRAGDYARVAAAPERASAAERRDNPRAAPAKLRWAVRAAVRA